MACDKETVLLISCYADNEVTPEEAVRAREHLEQCVHCRKMMEEWNEQQRMFEWAYTVEIPEESLTACSTEPTAREKKMSIAERVFGVSRRLYDIPVWTAAFAVVILGFILYRIVILPPVLDKGEYISALDKPLETRMEGGIRLEIGPHSKISRIDDRSIRLEKGWVSASVRHGSGLRIVTRRMEVVDKGTRFYAGAGPRLDYVVVEEGSVSICKDNRVLWQLDAGKMFIKPDKGDAVIAQVPETGSEDSDLGIPLSRLEQSFTPTSSENLDWDEAIERLGSRFPDVRWSGGRAGGSRSYKGLEYGISVGSLKGIRSGLSEHFEEIIKSAAGGHIESGDWEIPAALIQLRGASGLQDDVYYVRLVPEDGRVVWKFTGSNGMEADFPLELESPEVQTGSGGSSGPVKWIGRRIHHPNGKMDEVVTLHLMDWPGDFKPTLRLTLDGRRVSQSRKDVLSLIRESAAQTAGIKGLNLEGGASSTMYLDPKRRHRIHVAWNGEAGRELCHLTDLVKQGKGGAVVLGVIASDVPLTEPAAQAGVYLLRFVLQSPTDYAQNCGSGAHNPA